jgi:UDP-N-acetylglucosamine 1-carboxyvinyltransferase
MDTAVHFQSPSRADHTLVPDLIEIVTWICAATLMADRSLSLRAPRMHDARVALSPELAVLDDMGSVIDWNNDSCVIHKVSQLTPTNLTVTSHGIYSDAQPLVAVLAAYAHGTSLITETVWTERFSYATGLAALGFGVEVRPPKLTLRGGGPHPDAAPTCLVARDLRSAASLLVAALTVPGTAILEGMSHLSRGYTDLPGQLAKCGADIKPGVWQ